MQAVQQADFIVPVEIEFHWHHFHVLERPGVDNFLRAMGDLFEVVVYTASLSKVRVGYRSAGNYRNYPK
jgi:carboxy-terminal domain RNA polymerase II polypeptide A small phosphatase